MFTGTRNLAKLAVDAVPPSCLQGQLRGAGGFPSRQRGWSSTNHRPPPCLRPHCCAQVPRDRIPFLPSPSEAGIREPGEGPHPAHRSSDPSPAQSHRLLCWPCISKGGASSELPEWVSHIFQGLAARGPTGESGSAQLWWGVEQGQAGAAQGPWPGVYHTMSLVWTTAGEGGRICCPHH